MAIAYLGAMVASLASGTAVRRIGAIRASQAGLVLSAAGLALCMIGSPLATVAGAILIGLGYGPVTPASSHLLARITPPERMSFVFSIKQTGVPLGGVLAGVMIPSITQWTGWQSALAAVAIVNLCCAVLIAPLRATLDVDKDPTQRLSLIDSLRGPLGLVLRQRGLTLLAAVSFLFSVIQLSLISYLVTFLHDELGVELVTAGFALAVTQAGGMGGRVLWGYLADRFLGSVRALIVLSVVSVACALSIPFFHDLGPGLVTLGILAVFGACAVGWNGVYLAEVARQAPVGQAGAATGGTLAITFMGVVVGPPIFGVVAAFSGSYGFAYATLIVPAGLCIWLLGSVRSALVHRG